QRRARDDGREARIRESSEPFACSKLAEEVTGPEVAQPLTVHPHLGRAVEHDVEVAGRVPALDDLLSRRHLDLAAERALACELGEASTRLRRERLDDVLV